MVEAAAGGTLLLDEIGEMPLQAQASLLRFLEDKKVTPIGATKSISVDVRVIATTNRDLAQGIRDSAFREDLFYRLAVFTVHTPALRERDGDIEALTQHFLDAATASLGKPIHGVTEDALSILRQQDWPGNLRELRSWVFQAAMACPGHRLTAADLLRVRPSAPTAPASLNDAVHSAEKVALQKTLSQNVWNIAKTARDLGVSRMTLYRLMAKHRISRGPEEKRGR
jgi:transcriptional regulator with PAS, ATPase and Fis domain